jgi:hypothetical protein
MMIQAQNWPLAEGHVLGTHQSRDADGVVKVTLTYTFKVNFGGMEFHKSFGMMVARDGVEPPTPAFSVRSTKHHPQRGPLRDHSEMSQFAYY